MYCRGNVQTRGFGLTLNYLKYNKYVEHLNFNFSKDKFRCFYNFVNKVLPYHITSLLRLMKVLDF